MMSTEKDIADRLRAAYVQSSGNRVGDPFVSAIAREIASVAARRSGREVVAQAVEELGDRTHIGNVPASAFREAIARYDFARKRACPCGAPAGVHCNKPDCMAERDLPEPPSEQPVPKGTPIPPSLVGEVVEAARAYQTDGQGLCLSPERKRLNRALSAYDAAPRIGVEEIARAICAADGYDPDSEIASSHARIVGTSSMWREYEPNARAVLSLLASGVPAGEPRPVDRPSLDDTLLYLSRLDGPVSEEHLPNFHALAKKGYVDADKRVDPYDGRIFGITPAGFDRLREIASGVPAGGWATYDAAAKNAWSGPMDEAAVPARLVPAPPAPAGGVSEDEFREWLEEGIRAGDDLDSAIAHVAASAVETFTITQRDASSPAGEVSEAVRNAIRNKTLEEAAEALIAASEGDSERWVGVSDDMGRYIGARLEGRTQKLLRGMQAAIIVRSLKTKDA